MTAFNPDNPDPSQLPAVGAHLEPVVGAANLLADMGLSSIPGGTDDERDRLEALAEAIELENDNALDEAGAAQRKARRRLPRHAGRRRCVASRARRRGDCTRRAEFTIN